MTDIDWSKAPDWATSAGRTDDSESAAWLGDTQYQYIYGCWSGRNYNYGAGGLSFRRDEFKVIENRPAIPRPLKPEWDGTGLPPVGSVVEYSPQIKLAQGRISKNWISGDRLEVIAHKSVDGDVIPLVWHIEREEAQTIVPESICPIRTERDRAIEEMLSLDPDNGKFTSRKDFCGILFDHGYRKP